jgi:hypothetical protein
MSLAKENLSELVQEHQLSVIATDTNDTTISPSVSNTYKPVLVKASKEVATTRNSKTTQSKDNQDLRDTNNGNNTRNNTNGVNNLALSIDIVSSSVARIEEVYVLVKRSFVYKPNIELVVNAIIETGKFNAKRVADNICTVFSEKEPTSNRKSPIHLSDNNLQKCREIQAEVREILGMDIDIHPVLNSMLYTGRINARDIATALRKLFSEKSKTIFYQNSNRIN